jgi:hypothetical protein
MVTTSPQPKKAKLVHLKKRWAIAISAALTLGLVIGTAGPAAAALPGEEAQWHLEEMGNARPVTSTDTYHEARQTNGDDLGIWRGDGDNRIWVRFNGENAYEIRVGFSTTVAPTVVPFGIGWAAFFTGTDHNIYWATAGPEPHAPQDWSNWIRIGGNTTAQSVSVTQPGPNSINLLMAYRGDFRDGNDDQRLFWIWYDGTAGTWSDPQLMTDGAHSPSAPTVAWSDTGENRGAGRVYATHQGQNNQIYTSSLLIGTNDWTPWQGWGGVTHSSPQIAVNNNNDIVVTHRADDGQLWTRVFADLQIGGITPLYDWTLDSYHLVSMVTAALVTIGATVYILATATDHRVYFKRIFNR